VRLLPSQVIIIAAIALFLWYAFRLRSMLRDRLIVTLIVGAGLVLAVNPDLSTIVAHRVGIGRGADLLLYLLLLFSLFSNVHMAARLRAIDARITAVVRQVALDGAVLSSRAEGE
jgi:small membrane protein